MAGGGLRADSDGMKRFAGMGAEGKMVWWCALGQRL